MADVEVEMSIEGCDAVRNSAEVTAALLARAAAIASAAAGAGCECVCDAQKGRKRVHVRVSTANEKAARANYRTNALLKALGAGR
jgi:hypothetical protein